MVQARIDTLLLHNRKVIKNQIPVESVTASASGLDPHLSPAAAKIQIARIASIRNVSYGILEAMVIEHTESPLMGVLGPAKVNILRLNIALDGLK